MTTINRHYAGGFSLPEMMIAVTIGLIVLAAVSSMFVTSKRTYDAGERFSRVQENGRFAMHYLLKDLRLAGYMGCLSDLTPDRYQNTLNGPSDFFYSANIGIEGLEAGTGTWYPSTSTSVPAATVAGTDMVTMRMVDPATNIGISKEMPSSSAELEVTDVSGFSENDIIVVSDCATADVMQVTQVQTASSKLQHNPGGAAVPGNSTQKLQKRYGEDAKIYRFSTRRFFIRNNTYGVPSLYVDYNGAGAQELVEGIEDMQILYGIDTDADRFPNAYLRAGAAGTAPLRLQTETDWANVVGVRIAILARTLDAKDVDTDTSTYQINDKSATPGGKYQRKVFLTTVLLRNLQPQ